MAKQILDTEFVAGFKQFRGLLEDSVSSIKKGLANTTELAEESGVGKFIESCNEANVSADALSKVVEEMITALDTVIKNYEDIEAAMAR